MTRNSTDIHPKVAAGTAGAALATLVVFTAQKLGLHMTADEAGLVGGALATLFSFAFGYVRRGD